LETVSRKGGESRARLRVEREGAGASTEPGRQAPL